MKNNMLIYVSKDGKVKVDVSIENETIWMSLNTNYYENNIK